MEVYLDKNAFEDASIDTAEETLTNKLKNISYRAAIKLILNDLEADIIVHNEVLLITTKERISSDPVFFQTKIYPVEDLVTLITINEETKKTESYVDFDSIIDMIQVTIVPYSWQDAGEGEGTISGFETKKASVLIISQTSDTHRKIESLITKLRKHHQSLKKEKIVSPSERRYEGGLGGAF